MPSKRKSRKSSVTTGNGAVSAVANVSSHFNVILGSPPMRAPAQGDYVHDMVICMERGAGGDILLSNPQLIIEFKRLKSENECYREQIMSHNYLRAEWATEKHSFNELRQSLDSTNLDLHNELSLLKKENEDLRLQIAHMQEERNESNQRIAMLERKQQHDATSRLQDESTRRHNEATQLDSYLTAELVKKLEDKIRQAVFGKAVVNNQPRWKSFHMSHILSDTMTDPDHVKWAEFARNYELDERFGGINQFCEFLKSLKKARNSSAHAPYQIKKPLRELKVSVFSHIRALATEQRTLCDMEEEDVLQCGSSEEEKAYSMLSMIHQLVGEYPFGRNPV
jgi:hypothetical protein